MRTSQANADHMDDCDDIFGPPRSYPTAYPPRNRPSMISAKYKLKEERRKVLKISLNKLKKIDDPEANLCRSVLINNTMKRLQQETKDEKAQKQQLSYPRCYNNDSYLNIKTEFLKNEKPASTEPVNFTTNEQVEDIDDLRARLEEEILNACDYNESTSNENESASKKRLFEEMMDECDMRDVLSQFYLPPTPRMITSIDEDEQLNVVDEDPLAKRLKTEESLANNNNESSSSSTSSCSTSFMDYPGSVTSFINNNIPSSRFSVVESDTTTSSYTSCGQASKISEMQSSVYHNFIASLET